MTSNESKKSFDLSLLDMAQPYFCKATSQDSQDRTVSLREKCLSIIQTDSKLIERLFRDCDGLSLIRNNPKFLHNLHLDIKAKFVDKEDFYKDEVKSMASGKGERSAVAKYGHIWKRMYLEEKFTNLLQDAEEVDDATLLVLIESFQDYIFTLQLKNFSNLSLLQNILPSLTNLTSLELEYGHKLSTNNSLKSMQHQQKGSSLFDGMQISDAQSLARALNSLPHLCSLSLANSQINDKVLNAFFQELQSSHAPDSCDLRDSLIELDLSFNKIHPDGFHRIIKYFFPSSSLEEDKDDPNHHHAQKQEGNGEEYKNCGILITFKLAGNEIGTDGAKILARMLETNTSLQELDVRMNDLKDDGGQLVLEGLRHNHTLKKLNMACNKLSTKTANCLCSVMNQQRNDGQYSTLEILDVSCNMFVDSDFTNIVSSVTKSSDSNNLIELDLRGDYDSITARDSISTIEVAMMSKRRVAKRGKHCHF